jgi:hypothetical protein
MNDLGHSIREVWWQGYLRLLGEAVAGGSVSLRPPHQERRQYPRFPLHSQDIATPGTTPVDVYDISVSGVAFRGDRTYFRNRPLTLSLARVFSTETDVLGCELATDIHSREIPVYRVRCRFRDDEQGLQFLMLALELDRIERA